MNITIQTIIKMIKNKQKTLDKRRYPCYSSLIKKNRFTGASQKPKGAPQEDGPMF